PARPRAQPQTQRTPRVPAPPREAPPDPADPEIDFGVPTPPPGLPTPSPPGLPTPVPRGAPWGQGSASQTDDEPITSVRDQSAASHGAASRHHPVAQALAPREAVPLDLGPEPPAAPLAYTPPALDVTALTLPTEAPRAGADEQLARLCAAERAARGGE